jgi:septum site-determining protein MinD
MLGFVSVLDSPAGIESGARHAMYFCDDAVIVTNPELSALRDGDKMVGFIWYAWHTEHTI